MVGSVSLVAFAGGRSSAVGRNQAPDSAQVESPEESPISNYNLWARNNLWLYYQATDGELPEANQTGTKKRGGQGAPLKVDMLAAPYFSGYLETVFATVDGQELSSNEFHMRGF